MFELDDKIRGEQQSVEVVEKEDEDVVIEDVSPKKKEVPMFTKKGKMVLALFVVGGFLYYLWNKRQGASQQPQPVAPEQTEAKPVEVKAEATPSEDVAEEI